MSRENDGQMGLTTGSVADSRVSRRDFPKMGALAGAALGVGGGLTGALAACGGDDSSGGGSGDGREIKIGFVTPLTGPLASFGIPDAIAATDMHTIGGQVTWSSSDEKLNPVPNVCTTPITGGQWVKGDKYPYNLVVVNNSQAPEVPTQSALQPIKY